MRYSCNLCEFNTAYKCALNIHNKSLHEGIKYSCDQCDYKASQKGHLKQHKVSIHDKVGTKYQCAM